MLPYVLGRSHSLTTGAVSKTLSLKEDTAVGRSHYYYCEAGYASKKMDGDTAGFLFIDKPVVCFLTH